MGCPAHTYRRGLDPDKTSSRLKEASPAAVNPVKTFLNTRKTMSLAIGGSSSASNANKYASEINALMKQVTSLQKELVQAATLPAKTRQTIIQMIQSEIQAIEAEISTLTGMQSSMPARQSVQPVKPGDTKLDAAGKQQAAGLPGTSDTATARDVSKGAKAGHGDDVHSKEDKTLKHGTTANKTAKQNDIPTLLGNAIDDHV
jgi:hypothetical protein